jgi:3'-5' exoribonuclease
VQKGEAFRRAAAARNYHHARRGGLVEHTAQMMRAAIALAAVYPRLNRDLLLAGVLFHDAGKVWENNVAKTGFGIEHSERGELIGHISLGLELVNDLWRQLLAEDAFAAWAGLEPAADREPPRRADVRIARRAEDAGGQRAALHR